MIDAATTPDIKVALHDFKLSSGAAWESDSD
jgi:hypothetical protein